MTLLNTWSNDGATRGGDGELRAIVACDSCLPPDMVIAMTAREVATVGWSFRDFEAGPHRCPLCRRRRSRARRLRYEPQRHPALPNVIVIGAGKCGTSSLHSYLGAHPEIQMSDIKELRFFLDPEWRQKLDTYASYFDGDAPLRGESTPPYTLYPIAQEVPERIAAVVPDAKLIYLVRDPIERTISHFVERSEIWHRQAPERGFGDLTDPYNIYIAGGRFATQLERYLAVFPSEQLLVLDHADLLANRRDTLRSVFRFLGADESYWSPEYDVVHNPRDRKVRWTAAGRRWTTGRTAEAIRHLLPQGPRRVLFAPAKRAMTGRIRPPAVDESTREELRRFFRPEVERLRQITGMRFPTWEL